MKFPTPLVPARLLRRYKRFLADMRLDDGREVTAHCPNPGRMTGLAEPGMRCWLEPVAGVGRKLPFAWRLVELAGGHLAGIDSALANRVVREGLEVGAVPGLEDVASITAEARCGEGTRLDFRLERAGGGVLWLEVKNAHLSRAPGIAEFPDTRTDRGRRHLEVLARRARAGEGAMVLYLVQRSDAEAFRLAGDIDPGYVAAMDEACRAGVSARAFRACLSREEITMGPEIPVLEAVR